MRGCLAGQPFLLLVEVGARLVADSLLQVKFIDQLRKDLPLLAVEETRVFCISVKIVLLCGLILLRCLLLAPGR